MHKADSIIIIALTLALAGCSGEARKLREAAGPTVCKVMDSEGRFYEATAVEPLNALDTASYRCALAARDPTSCQQVACAPVQ